MHPEAHDAVGRMLDLSGIERDASWRVLDLGGRDINGTIRAHLPKATWTGTDIEPGPGVDIVHDATLPWPQDAGQFDVVVCTEVLEHLPLWRLVLHAAAEALEPGGPELLVVTCASDGRPEHGVAGAPLPAPGEWYGNVPPGHLRDTLESLFREVHVEYRANPGDAYAWARGVLR
ncbi:methyltransferase domain-containing protein [Streptomyces sp. NPDC056352]|uniref:methyltransferase domain-containing protein n=1 Tax=Streptomyces sp. NPDC056352 TaxID=3345791 RepID=UPI0035E116F9